MLDWLTSRFRGSETKALTYDQLSELFGVQPTYAGASVTVETAMGVPAVYGTVKTLAESVAQIPFILYQRDAQGGSSRAKSNPLYAVLHDMANAWTPAYDFRASMMTAALTHGNAFAWIGRAGGVVKELVQLPSDRVSVELTEFYEPRYRVADQQGRSQTYGFRDILHVHGIGTKPHIGDSPIHRMRNAISIAIGAEEYTGRQLAQGLKPSGILKVPNKLTPEAVQKLKDGLAANYGGAAKAGRPMVLEDGLDWTTVAQTAADAQLMELRLFAVREIARGYRLPLHFLGDLEKATFSNVESLGQQFVSFTLQPWLLAWEGAVRRAMLPAGGALYAEHLVDALTRADLAARFTAYATAITNGFLSQNEVRALENRAPIDGGDRHFAPLNITPNTGGSDGTA